MLKDFGKQTNKHEPKLLSAIKCLSSNVMINIIWKWKSTRGNSDTNTNNTCLFQNIRKPIETSEFTI